MCFSISAAVSLTTSSMRDGWMRPSWISFVRVAVDGARQDAAGLLLGLLPQVVFVLLQAGDDDLGQLALQPLHEHGLGLVAAEAAQLVELLRLLLDQLLHGLGALLDLGAA